MKRFYFFILLILFFCIQLKAEKTTEGKEFWLSFYGFMEENVLAANPDTLELFVLVSSKNGCTGNITNPNTGHSQNFTVAAGTVEKVLIPYTECYNRSDGDTILIANKGLFVTTSDTVSLYLGNYMQHSFDAAAVLPVPSLGYSYKISNYINSYASCFIVVATEDNTQIEVTLNDTVWDENTARAIYLPDSAYIINLNRGQTFLASGYNLIGSMVKSISCDPIAVFAGDYCPYVPDTCGWCDVLVEQMQPIYTWGKEFLVYSTLTRPVDSKVIIVTKEDNTTVNVKINGVVTPYIVNADEYKELDSSLNGIYIQADKPIAVTQYAIGRECSGLGDPFMLWINPIEQKLEDVIFNGCPSVNISFHIIQIFTLTSYKDSTYFDGINIGGSFIQFPQNTNYSVARFLITPTTHRITNEAGFMAYAYGYADGITVIDESYGYSVGSSSYNIEDVYYVRGWDGLTNNIYFDTDSINNIYNPWDTITIERDIQSVFDSVAWVLNGLPLVVPEENNQPQLTVKLPACRLKDGINTLGMVIYRDCMNDTVWANLWLRKALFDLITEDQTICEGDSVQLSATTNIPIPEFIWYTKTDTLTDHSDSPFVDPIDTTRYYVYAKLDTYHTDTDSLMVNVKPKTYNTIIDSICPSDSYDFYGNILTLSGIYLDTLVNVLGCDSVVTLDLSITNAFNINLIDTICEGDVYPFGVRNLTIAGIYTDSLTTTFGCDSVVTLELVVLPPEYTYLTATIKEGEYYLFGGDSLYVEGTYNDTLLTIWNCDSILVLDLEVIKSVQPPDVFTPNNDGVNDFFVIKNIEQYPNNKILIFNRWGNKVWEAGPYLNNWDGTCEFGITIGGNDLPVGTYFYIIELGEDLPVMKGYVYLNR